MNYIIIRLNLIDIYRMPHSTTAKYTFFSSGHGRFPRIDYRLVHKANLSTFKRIKIIILSMFSNHHRMKLEINNKEMWEIYRSVEIKPHTAKQPISQRRNPKGS